MGGDGADEEGLQGDVFVDKGGVHGEGCGRGGFAIEVAGGGEVVEAGLQGDFVFFSN